MLKGRCVNFVDFKKIFFVLISILAFLSFGKNTQAALPNANITGVYAGSVEIKKADTPKIDVDALDYYPADDRQNLNILSDFYKNIGVVYYKLGENGEWSAEIPSFKYVGNYTLYYYVKGNENYNDLGSQKNPLSLSVNVKVDKTDWGELIYNGGIANYLAQDGTTSAEVTGDEVIWLKEDSEGESSWYVLDNRQGIFAKGSRFWVRWLSEKDGEEFREHFENLDESHKKWAEENKLWIFLTGVIAPDGTEYTNLDVNVPYYIQLGDEWDEEDVKAVFISKIADEPVSVSFGTVAEFNRQFDNINFPVQEQDDKTSDSINNSEYKNVKSDDNSQTKRCNKIKTGIYDFKNTCLIIIFIALLILNINSKIISRACDKYNNKSTVFRLKLVNFSLDKMMKINENILNFYYKIYNIFGIKLDFTEFILHQRL